MTEHESRDVLGELGDMPALLGAAGAAVLSEYALRMLDLTRLRADDYADRWALMRALNAERNHFAARLGEIEPAQRVRLVAWMRLVRDAFGMRGRVPAPLGKGPTHVVGTTGASPGGRKGPRS